MQTILSQSYMEMVLGVRTQQKALQLPDTVLTHDAAL